MLRVKNDPNLAAGRTYGSAAQTGIGSEYPPETITVHSFPPKENAITETLQPMFIVFFANIFLRLSIQRILLQPSANAVILPHS